MRSPSVCNVQKPVKRGTENITLLMFTVVYVSMCAALFIIQRVKLSGVRHAVATVGFNATTARDTVS